MWKSELAKAIERNEVVRVACKKAKLKKERRERLDWERRERLDWERRERVSLRREVHGEKPICGVCFSKKALKKG